MNQCKDLRNIISSTKTTIISLLLYSLCFGFSTIITLAAKSYLDQPLMYNKGVFMLAQQFDSQQANHSQ